MNECKQLVPFGVRALGGKKYLDMKDVIEVFRLEDPDGFGPFANLTGSDYSAVELLPNYMTEVSPRWDDAIAFPSFYSDKAFQHLSVAYRKKYKFSFNSIEGLLRSFTKPELKYMAANHHIHIFRLKVNNYIQSEFQTIFKGNPLEKEDITSEFLDGVSMASLLDIHRPSLFSIVF